MNRGARRLAAGIGLSFLLTACPGDPQSLPPTPSGSPTTTAPSPSLRAGEEPGPTVTATPKPSRPSSPRPRTSPSPTATSGTPTVSPPRDVVVTLDRACVRRGVAADVQGITVHTDPGYPAGYATEYSDGSTIVGHPEYQSGGQGTGFADQNGVFRQTWVVPDRAPLGRAIVHVNVGTVDPPKIPFRIVGRNQTCT